VNGTTTGGQKAEKVRVPHCVGGRFIWGDETEYASRDLGAPFVTPRLHFNDIVLPRSQPGPAFDVPVSEIIDYLVEVGKHLVVETNVHLQEALEHTLQTSELPTHIIANTFRRPGQSLTREVLEYRLERALGSIDVVDGWVEHKDPNGRVSRVRAFPPRLVHVLAGNSPSAAISSIVSAALVKAVNVFKMPSADPFSTVAVLRTMADVDPDHPVLRSMTAVYWRGGDTSVESVLYRPQYFDKLVAWGGGDAITNVAKYVGPGFQLVSFDPKVSISIIGREAFESEATLEHVADLAASDVTIFNGDACVASRFIFVEGDDRRADELSALVCARLGVDREYASAVGPATPPEIRDAVEGMRFLEPEYRIWGSHDGTGLVVRSPDPVEFHPPGKTVNVVPVRSVLDALDFVTVATQTVGVYPSERKLELRDRLATAGVQRVVNLGSAFRSSAGNPHDGMWPLHRFVNWVVDDDA
jgi:hypothetical protein